MNSRDYLEKLPACLVNKESYSEQESEQCDQMVFEGNSQNSIGVNFSDQNKINEKSQDLENSSVKQKKFDNLIKTVCQDNNSINIKNQEKLLLNNQDGDSCNLHKKLDLKKISDLQKLKDNLVSSSKVPFLLKFSEIIVYLSIIVYFYISVMTYGKYKDQKLFLGAFCDDHGRINEINNSLLKLTNYMQFRSLLTQPYNLNLDIITTDLQENLQISSYKAYKFSQKEILGSIIDSSTKNNNRNLYQKYYLTEKNWNIKSEHQVLPTLNYYLQVYEFIKYYFSNANSNFTETENIVLTNKKSFTEYISEFRDYAKSYSNEQNKGLMIYFLVYFL